MIFRYWLQSHRLWYMPWKWRIYEWHAYEVERIIKNEYGRLEQIACAAYAKTGRWITKIFNSKDEADDFIYTITYNKKVTND